MNDSVLSRDAANDLAVRYLGADSSRYWHSVGVQHMIDAIVAGSEWESDAVLSVAGIVHDIGYGAPVTGAHFVDGARVLRSLGFEAVAGAVAYHSTAVFEAPYLGAVEALGEFSAPAPVVGAVLWVADYSVSPQGAPVPFEWRWAEIRSRYGSGSAPVRALDDSGAAWWDAVDVLVSAGLSVPFGLGE